MIRNITLTTPQLQPNKAFFPWEIMMHRYFTAIGSAVFSDLQVLRVAVLFNAVVMQKCQEYLTAFCLCRHSSIYQVLIPRLFTQTHQKSITCSQTKCSRAMFKRLRAAKTWSFLKEKCVQWYLCCRAIRRRILPCRHTLNNSNLINIFKSKKNISCSKNVFVASLHLILSIFRYIRQWYHEFIYRSYL